jgi:hypothetical protein
VNLGLDYLDVLSFCHAYLAPRTYLEIGVRHGRSLCLARPGTRAVAVDPEIDLRFPTGHLSLTCAAMTSEEFFSTGGVGQALNGEPLDMTLIDGMHRFEVAFHDFVNAESVSHQGSVILMHDTLPRNATMARRQQMSGLWTGDVWRTVVALRKWRPQLSITTLDVAPTGLTIITDLDPTRALRNGSAKEALRQASTMSYRDLVASGWDELNVIRCSADAVRTSLPRAFAPVSPTSAREARVRLSRVALMERLLLLRHIRPQYWRLRELIRAHPEP